MKPHLKLSLILAGSLLVALVFFILLSRVGAELFRPSDPRLAEARVSESIRDLHFYARAKRANFVAFSLVGAVACLSLSVAGAMWLSTVSFRDGDIQTRVSKRHASVLAAQAVEAKRIEAEVQRIALSDETMLKRLSAFTGAIKQLRTDTRSHIIDVSPEPKLLPAHVPTFRELLERGDINPGHPLTMGFDKGDPQHRSLEEIVALSVAGWQGSGKTLSTAYLISCLLLQFPGSEGWIIDPHKNHEKGLANHIRPYETSGRIHIVNPFETKKTIEFLNTRLNARLDGVEPSTPLLFLVIDELSQLGKTDVFKDTLKPFLDRCTEETRKANMVFIGGGQKWQARYFDGDASFRQSVPSMLVHKLKPSQADLLFEDAVEKKMVKQLTGPGSALLSTSHNADPCLVQMPLITRHDIQTVSQRLVSNGRGFSPVVKKKTVDPDTLTPEICKYIREQIGVSQRILAQKSGVSLSKLKRYELSQATWEKDELTRIERVLFPEKLNNVVHLKPVNRLSEPVEPPVNRT